MFPQRAHNASPPTRSRTPRVSIVQGQPQPGYLALTHLYFDYFDKVPLVHLWRPLQSPDLYNQGLLALACEEGSPRSPQLRRHEVRDGVFFIELATSVADARRGCRNQGAGSISAPDVIISLDHNARHPSMPQVVRSG